MQKSFQLNSYDTIHNFYGGKTSSDNFYIKLFFDFLSTEFSWAKYYGTKQFDFPEELNISTLEKLLIKFCAENLYLNKNDIQKIITDFLYEIYQKKVRQKIIDNLKNSVDIFNILWNEIKEFLIAYLRIYIRKNALQRKEFLEKIKKQLNFSENNSFANLVIGLLQKEEFDNFDEIDFEIESIVEEFLGEVTHFGYFEIIMDYKYLKELGKFTIIK